MKKLLFSVLLLTFFTASLVAMQQPDPNTILLTINKDPLTIEMLKDYVEKNRGLFINEAPMNVADKLEILFSYVRRIIASKATAHVPNNVINLYSAACDSGLVINHMLLVNPGSAIIRTISEIEIVMYGHYINDLLNTNYDIRENLLNTVDGLTNQSNTLEYFYDRIIKPLDASNSVTFTENIGHVFTLWYASHEFKNVSTVDNEYSQVLMGFTHSFSHNAQQIIRNNFKLIPASNARELIQDLQF